MNMLLSNYNLLEFHVCGMQGADHERYLRQPLVEWLVCWCQMSYFTPCRLSSLL